MLLKRDVTKEKYSVGKVSCESEVEMPRYYQSGMSGVKSAQRRGRRFAAQRASRAAFAARKRFGSRYVRAARDVMELKSIDVSATTAVNTTYSVALLNGIATGDDIASRDGRRVTMRSVQIRAINYVDSGTGIDQVHRVLLVQDKQTNGAALTVGDVIDSASYGVLANRNMSGRERFVVLMDKTFDLSEVASEKSKISWEFYRKLSLPVIYNNTGSAVTDIASGSLYLLFLGTVAAGGQAGSCFWNCRIRFEA